MNAFEFFATYLMIPFILIIGVIGNLLGLIVLTQRKNSKMGPVNMYKCLFVTDTIFLVLVVENYLQYGFQSNLTILSKYVCKLFWYINYLLAPVSPMILVYIAIEKVISIKHPAKKYILRSKKIQIIFMICLVTYNSMFYIPIVYFFKINYQINNKSENVCEYDTIYHRVLINSLDIANRVIIPFILKTTISVILLISIQRMRGQMLEQFRSNNHKNLKKEINLLLNLIFMNLFYIVLSLPFGIVTYNDFNSYEFMIVLYLFNSAYAFNFYILLVSNASFRNEFLILFGFKKIQANTYRPKKKTEINLRF